MAASPPAASPLLLAAGCCSVLLSLERLHAAALSRNRGAEVTFGESPAYHAHGLDTAEDQFANLTAVDFESMMDPENAQPLVELTEAECGDTPEGSSCYHAVMWLLMGGFDRHPDWYPGYSSESSFHEVQSMLHSIGKGHCTEPCESAAQRQQAPGASTSSPPASPGCHDAVEGEWCFQSLSWLKARGITLHPARYPNLHPGSTTGEMQAELHRLGKSQCREPCTSWSHAAQDGENSSDQGNASDQDLASESPAEPQEAPVEASNTSDACDDAEPLSQCYLAVKYAMSEGIRTSPDVFPGLAPGATFRQVQESFHSRGRYACARPCPLPDTKKPVDQMSEEELARYLSGEWDGMVKAGEAPAVAADGAAQAQEAGQNATVDVAADGAAQAPEVGQNATVDVAADGAAQAPEAGQNATVDVAADGAAQAPEAGQNGGRQLNSARGEAAQSLSSGRLSEALQRGFGTAGRAAAEAASREAPGSPQQAEAGPTEFANSTIDAKVPRSPEEWAALLKQQVLRQLEQAENETDDPRTLAAIRKTKADFQAASSGAMKAAEDNQASKALEDDIESASLPYVDDHGLEKTIQEKSAEVEWNMNQTLENQLGETEEEMTARLAKQILAEFNQAQSSTTQKVETEEEMTARLTKQILEEFSQAQNTSIPEVETEQKMTARQSNESLTS